MNQLETPRLILRPFQESDLEAFAAYRSDPQVARFQSWQAPYTLEQAAAFIRDMQTIQPGTPGEWYQLALERNSTPGLIGDCPFTYSPMTCARQKLDSRWQVAFKGRATPRRLCAGCWTTCSPSWTCIARPPSVTPKILLLPGCWSGWGCAGRGISSRISGSKAPGAVSMSIRCCKRNGTEETRQS